MLEVRYGTSPYSQGTLPLRKGIKLNRPANSVNGSTWASSRGNTPAKRGPWTACSLFAAKQAHIPTTRPTATGHAPVHPTGSPDPSTARALRWAARGRDCPRRPSPTTAAAQPAERAGDSPSRQGSKNVFCRCQQRPSAETLSVKAMHRPARLQQGSAQLGECNATLACCRRRLLLTRCSSTSSLNVAAARLRSPSSRSSWSGDSGATRCRAGSRRRSRPAAAGEA